VTIASGVASNLQIVGAVTCPTATGAVQLLDVHVDRLSLARYALQTTDPGAKVRVLVNLNLSGVDIYTEKLTATIAIPGVPLSLRGVSLTAASLPAGLPLRIPTADLSSVALTQNYVAVAVGQFTGLELSAHS
jgi:hypothetical protein